MTVELVTAVSRYVGLSSDTKPTTAVAGATFYETDTGGTYIYAGGAWSLIWDAGPYRASKTITFTGATDLGAVGAVPLFTVTGEVLIDYIVPWCDTLLTEAAGTATIALGVTGATTLFVTTTNAVDIDAGEFWVDATPDANGIAVPAALKGIAITQNIIGTVGTQAVDSGVLRIDVYWRPLSADGLVAPA